MKTVFFATLAIIVYLYLVKNSLKKTKTIDTGKYQLTNYGVTEKEFEIRKKECDPGQAVIYCNIFISPKRECFVTFQAKDEINIHEYIRLVIHYFSKLLFNFCTDDKEANIASDIMRTYINIITKSNINRDANILSICDIDDVVSIVDYLPSRYDLYSLNLRVHKENKSNRYILTNFPNEGNYQDTVFSLIVLIEKIINMLQKEDISILLFSLESIIEQNEYSGNFDLDMNIYDSYTDLSYHKAIKKATNEVYIENEYPEFIELTKKRDREQYLINSNLAASRRF